MAGLLTADDFKDAEPVETITPNEARLRQQTGATANGSVPPSVAVVDTAARGRGVVSAAPRASPGLLQASDFPAAPQQGQQQAPQQEQPATGVQEADQVQYTPRDMALAGRGMVKGAAGVITTPMDIKQWYDRKVMNFVKSTLGFGEQDDGSSPNAGELVDKGLSKVGFPEAKNESERSAVQAGDITGGMIAGAALPGSGGKKAIEDYWSSAGPEGGANKQIINALTAQKVGEQGVTKLTPTVLGRASDRITGVLDASRGADRVVVAAPEEVGKNIFAIAGEHTATDGRMLKNDAVVQLFDSFNDDIHMGVTNAHQLGQLSTRLGRAADNAVHTDYDLAQGLYKTKEYVESLIKEGMQPAEIQAYETAQQQYRWLAKLKQPGMISRSADGTVNATKLATDLESTDATGFSLGKNNEPLYQVLRKVQGSDGTAMPALYHSKMMILARAAARLGPGMAQQVVQKGLQPGMRMMINKPGFLNALGDELNQQSENGLQ